VCRERVDGGFVMITIVCVRGVCCGEGMVCNDYKRESVVLT